MLGYIIIINIAAAATGVNHYAGLMNRTLEDISGILPWRPQPAGNFMGPMFGGFGHNRNDNHSGYVGRIYFSLIKMGKYKT